MGAATAGVDKSKVSVVISDARRLRELAAALRLLSGGIKITATIKDMSATEVAALTTKAASTTTLAATLVTELKKQPGIKAKYTNMTVTIAAPTFAAAAGGT